MEGLQLPQLSAGPKPLIDQAAGAGGQGSKRNPSAGFQVWQLGRASRYSSSPAGPGRVTTTTGAPGQAIRCSCSPGPWAMGSPVVGWRIGSGSGIGAQQGLALGGRDQQISRSADQAVSSSAGARRKQLGRPQAGGGGPAAQGIGTTAASGQGRTGRGGGAWAGLGLFSSIQGFSVWAFLAPAAAGLRRASSQAAARAWASTPAGRASRWAV